MRSTDAARHLDRRHAATVNGAGTRGPDRAAGGGDVVWPEHHVAAVAAMTMGAAPALPAGSPTAVLLAAIAILVALALATVLALRGH